MRVVHKAPAATEEKSTPLEEVLQQPQARKSLYTIFREFLSSRLGGVKITRPDMEDVPAEAAGNDFKQDETLKMYHVTIYTGAGSVKMGVEGVSKKDAEDRALVDYVRRLTVKAELYKK